MSYDALFSPIKIRGLELKNRVVLPGMCTKMVRDKHTIPENLVAYHAARAAGGCGLNIFEVSAINPETHAYIYMGLYEESDIAEHRKVTEAIHAAGGKAGIQIWHGGFVPETYFPKGYVCQTPSSLSIDDIHTIVKQYGRGARMAVEAGYDVLEFHGAHSYLPHEFLSPTFNTRTDEYGGSFENRVRFIIEVVQEMRANMPEDMPLFMRFDAIDEMLKKNIPEEEIVAMLNLAVENGVDVVDLSRGNARSYATVYEVPPYFCKNGFNMENIIRVGRQVKGALVCGVGRVNDPALANKYIADGDVDLMAIGRAQIADPEWCNKAREGRDAEIRRCVGCNQGCFDIILDDDAPSITCTHNPEVGLECKPLVKAETPKKVMVVGGGMAGLMAAEVLKKRGHEPVVYEASDVLGGHFRLAGVPPLKHEMRAAAIWEGEEAERLGVEIHKNTAVTPELIAEVKPDEVIIATGSQYVAPEIPGIDGDGVCSYADVLSGAVEPSGKVVVLGAGSVGVEVATFLAKKGCSVYCIEAARIGGDLGTCRKMYVDVAFAEYGIKKTPFSKVTEIGDHTVTYKVTDKKTRKTATKERGFDYLVVCTGMKSKPVDALTEKCAELGIPCHVIGDAKKVRNAQKATADGYAVGVSI